MAIESRDFEGWPSGDSVVVMTIKPHPETLASGFRLPQEQGSDELDDFVATHCTLTHVRSVVFQYHLHAPIKQTLVLIDKEADIQSAIDEIKEAFALTSSQITWRLDVVPEYMGAH